MTLARRHLQHPSAGRPARDCNVFHPIHLPRHALERQHDAALFCHCDQLRARHIDRCAHAFLVAGEQHVDRHRIERASGFERPERFEHDAVAAFHVGHPLSPDTLAVGIRFPWRDRTLWFEHRIHMTQEQEPLFLRPLVRIDRGRQMPRAFHLRRHFDPARGKPQLLEGLAVELADCTYAVGVQRAAVDGDGFLQELQRRALARLHGGGHAHFCFVKQGLCTGKSARGDPAGDQRAKKFRISWFLPRGFHDAARIAA